MFNFTEKQIQEAISLHYPNYTDNLRYRDINLQKDCFVRGRLAEIFFRDFFKGHRFIIQSNVANNCEDIDLQIKGRIKEYNIEENFNKPINIEIKTSLIPFRGFNIYKNADLKIYKKTDNIACDIKWDIGIQVYFDKYKQEWENTIKCCSDKSSMTEEYEKLNFSCSWITRKEAISYINNPEVKEKTWCYGYKIFWKCPLKIHNHNLDNLIALLEKHI